jgi:hypothetical protein
MSAASLRSLVAADHDCLHAIVQFLPAAESTALLNQISRSARIAMRNPESHAGKVLGWRFDGSMGGATWLQANAGSFSLCTGIDLGHGCDWAVPTHLLKLANVEQTQQSDSEAEKLLRVYTITELNFGYQTYASPGIKGACDATFLGLVDLPAVDTVNLEEAPAWRHFDEQDHPIWDYKIEEDERGSWDTGKPPYTDKVFLHLSVLPGLRVIHFDADKGGFTNKSIEHLVASGVVRVVFV